MENLPRSLAAVDPAWLGTALSSAGHDAAVTAVDFTPMPGIVGALGEVGFLDVTYADETDLPSRFVGKCPLDDDMARLFNSVMQNYRREAGFYAEAAAEIEMQIPACYVNESDGADASVLLIEHISPADDGDILAGTSFANMTTLVADLGRMHGRYWMNDRLAEWDWLLDWSTPSFELGIPVVTEGWETYTAAHPDVIPADLAEVCRRTWIDDTVTWLARYVERPWTFTHGDYELDNMMFRDDGTIVILDWQTVLRSFPGVDLAWLLACSSDDEAIAREGELIDTYRAALLEGGGPDWSAEEVIEDCAWGMLYHVTGQTVPNTSEFDAGPAGQRAKARFERMMSGSVAAATRWDTAGRIGALL